MPWESTPLRFSRPQEYLDRALWLRIFQPLTGLLTAGVSTTGVGRVQVTPYTIPQDPNNFLTNDYGPSDYNQTNRFILQYTWDIPTSSQSRWLTGWMLSGVLVAESGQPFTIFAGPVAGELNQRVNLNAPLTMTGNPNGYIGNTSAIALPGKSCETQLGAQSPFVLQSTVGIRAGTCRYSVPRQLRPKSVHRSRIRGLRYGDTEALQAPRDAFFVDYVRNRITCSITRITTTRLARTVWMASRSIRSLARLNPPIMRGSFSSEFA